MSALSIVSVLDGRNKYARCDGCKKDLSTNAKTLLSNLPISVSLAAGRHQTTDFESAEHAVCLYNIRSRNLDR